MKQFNVKNLTDKETVELYYKIVSGGVRLKLLQSVIDFNLPELITIEGSLTEEQIIESLMLTPKRAQKWLYLLSLEGFLIQKKVEQPKTYVYSLGPILKALVINEEAWMLYKQFMSSWQKMIESENLSTILKGAQPKYELKWPPTPEESLGVEQTMTQTAYWPALAISKSLPASEIKNILDVGGGEGTISCLLASWFSHLHFTNYNLPESIKLARKKIDGENLKDRVHVIEGNFLIDTTFPSGFDSIIFCRVLCDWPDDICIKLLKMTYAALPPGGYVIICDPFRDSNHDLIVAWEYRYILWDDFGRAVFKDAVHYMRMLKAVGFRNIELSEDSPENMYRVLKAIK